jgi:hypothetical protein
MRWGAFPSVAAQCHRRPWGPQMHMPPAEQPHCRRQLAATAYSHAWAYKQALHSAKAAPAPSPQIMASLSRDQTTSLSKWSRRMRIWSTSDSVCSTRAQESRRARHGGRSAGIAKSEARRHERTLVLDEGQERAFTLLVVGAHGHLLARSPPAMASATM